MDNSSGISIIIPAYNMEKYVKQCLDSLLEQSFTDYEIICIDSGSTDGTSHILDSYVDRDCRFKVIHTSRLNAGEARNLGLKEAKKKYLLFLDADDFFENNMLGAVYERIEKYNAQVCLFGARHYKEGKASDDGWNFINMFNITEDELISGKNNPYIFEIATANPWNKLYDRKFVLNSGVRFQTIRRSNDVLFTYSMLTLAERITIDKNIYLNYRQHDSSLQATNDESPLDWCIAYGELKKTLISRGDYKNYKVGFQNKCLSITWYNFNKLQTYNGYIALFRGLVDKYFKEFDIDDMGAEDVYDYNNLAYELVCDMKKKSPNEMLWERSHRMVREVRESINQRDEEIVYLRSKIAAINTNQNIKKNGLKEILQSRLPATRRFVERRLNEQEKMLKEIHYDNQVLLGRQNEIKRLVNENNK